MAAAKTKTARKKPAAKKSAAGTRTSKKHNKLSKELILLIADRVGQGVPIKKAVEGIVHESTYYRWIEKGTAALEKDPDATDLYSELCKSVKKAEIEFMQKNLEVISSAAIEGKWQAAAWMLERRFPDEFSSKSPMNVNAHLTGKTDEDPIKTESTVQIYLPDNGRNRKTEKK